MPPTEPDESAESGPPEPGLADLSLADTLAKLRVSIDGLSTDEARRRLQQYGTPAITTRAEDE